MGVYMCVFVCVLVCVCVCVCADERANERICILALTRNACEEGEPARLATIHGYGHCSDLTTVSTTATITSLLYYTTTARPLTNTSF